jgi:hypothetical protein
MCAEKDFARQRLSSWSVWITGVGNEYEWSKNCLGRVERQLWSASFNIPFGFGNIMMGEYIAVAFGFVEGNRSRTLGCLSKRKWCRMGPRRPKGLMVNRRSAIYVADDAVAVGNDASVGVALVNLVELPLFVNLEMLVGIGR